MAVESTLQSGEVMFDVFILAYFAAPFSISIWALNRGMGGNEFGAIEFGVEGDFLDARLKVANIV
jgi:hypothetical protein